MSRFPVAGNLELDLSTTSREDVTRVHRILNFFNALNGNAVQPGDMAVTNRDLIDWINTVVLGQDKFKFQW